MDECFEAILDISTGLNEKKDAQGLENLYLIVVDLATCISMNCKLPKDMEKFLGKMMKRAEKTFAKLQTMDRSKKRSYFERGEAYIKKKVYAYQSANQE